MQCSLKDTQKIFEYESSCKKYKQELLFLAKFQEFQYELHLKFIMSPKYLKHFTNIN